MTTYLGHSILSLLFGIRLLDPEETVVKRELRKTKAVIVVKRELRKTKAVIVVKRELRKTKAVILFITHD